MSNIDYLEGDIVDSDAQVLAVVYQSKLFSDIRRFQKCEDFPDCSPGRIRVREGKNKYLLALYLEKENEVLRTCLDKIIECVNSLKSIAFDSRQFTDSDLDIIEEWAEKNFSVKIQIFEEEEDSRENLTYSDISLVEYTQKYTPKGWKKFFDDLIENLYLEDTSQFLQREAKSGKTIYPPLPEIYTAFESCPPQEIKVIIIGQDPYHTPGAAMGLAFGHHNTRKTIQPSLRNIYKELADDVGCPINQTSGDLTPWAKQGVFLINTALTVRKGDANSHGVRSNSKWSQITDQLFRYLNDHCEHLVVIMWGGQAKKKGKLFDDKKHYKITSVHPSGLSAHKGFFGSKPFSKTNKKLKDWGETQIDWTL